MEVWWAGFLASPARLLAYLTVGFLLLLGYNRYLGLRQDSTWGEVWIEAVEEMGLGIALSAAVLWLLGRIGGAMPLSEVLGKVVVESVPVAIGVAVGTAQLSGGGGFGKDRGMADDDDGTGGAGWWSELVLAAGGAILLAANVAPTEEIPVIALEIPPWKTLLLVAVSLGLAAMILHYSDFLGAEQASAAGGLARGATGVLVAYGVALVSSAFILWFFGRFAGTAPALCVAQTVVLGVPAT
ncbi:MAG TPA: DUF2391 family protein, partial [Thermoanaerobaculia bacterium]|nr:DUF2391 family protein [Thermoanaerobaculia bacterium]